MAVSAASAARARVRAPIATTTAAIGVPTRRATTPIPSSTRIASSIKYRAYLPQAVERNGFGLASTGRGGDVIERPLARRIPMKIVDAKVIVCCPGRNFVTLKITTED